MKNHQHRRTFLKGFGLTGAALLLERSALAHPPSANGTNPIAIPNIEEHTMSTYTAITVPTQFVEANGIRFTYRRWGKQGGIPLVFNQHFTGNLDNWDPAVLDCLTPEREVILFNNAGIAAHPAKFHRLLRNGQERGALSMLSASADRSSWIFHRRYGCPANYHRPSRADSQAHPDWNAPAQP